jgi:hypothetical protein
MFFPNQNFQGGDDTLTSRAREPLYLDGTPTPRDAPIFGQNWYSTYLWTDFGLKFIDEARQANKPFFLYLPHNAPHFPLMAPQELIARHRGKYKAGWDKLREDRYRRQIGMGLIEARWPMTPREADSPIWESLSDDAKDRFDHLMAVYAAMIEGIDTSVGVLVKGLEARGILDNTLILFMSDNGANAESGPDGRFNGDPPGGPNSNLYLGMNWASLGNTPFRRFKHFTYEGGIAVPLVVHWPQGIPAGRRNAVVQGAGHSAHGRRQPASGPHGPGAPAHAATLLGARRQPRGSLRQLEARVDVSWRLGALRHGGRSRRAQQPGSRASGSRQDARGGVGRVGRTRQRGSVAGAGPLAVGGRCSAAGRSGQISESRAGVIARTWDVLHVGDGA